MFYPEGAQNKSIVTFAIKWIAILVTSIILAFAIHFIVQKIEDNSQNAQYRIALKYLYLRNNADFKKTVEEVMTGLQNDSIRDIINNEIDKSPYVLK